MPSDRPWPRVSVVTPSYNQAQFVEETIRSVLLQGYPDVEYLIVDGCSRDGSVDIIRKYQHCLAYWVSEPDGGQANAINRGWTRATGEIVAYLNSDDVYYPGAIRSAVEHLVAHPEAGMVCGLANLIDATGCVFQECHHTFDFTRFLLWEQQVVQPAVFIRRSVLSEVGLLDEHLRYAMDYDLWLRIVRRFSVVNVPAVLAEARYHPTAKSVHEQIQMAEEGLAVWEAFFRQELPPGIAGLRNQAIAGAYVFRGYTHYFAGEMAPACRNALTAIRLTRRPRVARRALVLIAKTMLGSRLSSALRQARRARALSRLSDARISM